MRIAWKQPLWIWETCFNCGMWNGCQQFKDVVRDQCYSHRIAVLVLFMCVCPPPIRNRKSMTGGDPSLQRPMNILAPNIQFIAACTLFVRQTQELLQLPTNLRTEKTSKNHVVITSAYRHPGDCHKKTASWNPSAASYPPLGTCRCSQSFWRLPVESAKISTNPTAALSVCPRCKTQLDHREPFCGQ